MIDSELGFSRLERLLVDGSPYGAVIPIDWTKFLSQLPDGADRGYYSILTSAPKPRAAVAAKASSSSSLERLKAIPAGQRRDALAAELASNARQVIGLDDGTPIASTLPLREVGLDSLMAVELRNVLVRLGGQSLPATLLFDYPHLDALSSHLYRAWGLDFDAIPDPTTAPSEVPADDDLADLSDEEAEVPASCRIGEWRRSAEAPVNAPAQNAAMSPVKQALAEIRDLRARLAAAEFSRREPIAIVGMGMRFPGGVRDAESYAELLWSGRDAVTEIPPQRWSLDALYADDPDQPGKMTTRHGAFLDDVDQFDAEFFGISPREAASMDPQQRLILEVGWEALEDSGRSPMGLDGASVGVYLGNCKQRLWPRAVRASGNDRRLFQYRKRLQCRRRAAFLSTSDFRGRALRSTPRVRLPWSPFISRARRCASANAILRLRAA